MRVGSTPTSRTIMPRNKQGVLGGKMRGRTIEVLYTDLLFQLPPTLTISSAAQVRGSDSIGYEICGFAAKDLSKINEGEVKESLNIPRSRL